MNARAKWIIAASAALVLAGAASVAVVATSQSGGGSSQTPTADQTPAPVPPVVAPTTAPDATADAVVGASEDLISSVLSVTNTVNVGDIDAVLGSLQSVASPAYLSGVEAERMELEDQGWTRSGEVVIDGVETVSYDAAATPAQATVRACLDSSGVVIRNADGDVVPGGSPRAWNIFVLEQVDGAWMIMRQTFADDPAC
ncbi:hypothetical protein [Microbacterium sp. 179-I 3D4 NHS]|uniref:hypothetical protein n=1 Tax=Microbacterium sp. 179-I 3D4 NHS TaxID=3142381 RepID=UPI0039A37220